MVQASSKKFKPEEVRAYADRAAKMAEAYGTRWQRTVAFRLADILADQDRTPPSRSRAGPAGGAVAGTDR